jgi:26S proteasome regulatory subunit N3
VCGAQSAEFVCAKAIRDGVIDAVLDHENQWMSSNDIANVYSTTEPQKAFHKRINFCLDVRNEAVKAMRYPADAYKAKKKTQEVPKTEEEIAKEIEDELEEEM